MHLDFIPVFYYKLNCEETSDLRTKEVMMFRKSTNIVLLILLTLTVIFIPTSCKKLKTSRLQANYYFTRANSFFSEAKYRNAIEDYEKALSYNPELIDAFRYLGEAYKNLFKPGVTTPENMEKANKALEALNRAYEIDPDNKNVIYSLGDMYDKLRNYEEAEKLYLRIIELEPANMNNYYVVAEFYKRYVTVKVSGTPDEKEDDMIAAATPFRKAEEMYLRRIETDPYNPQGYAYIAQFYDDQQPSPMFDEACKYHRMRITLDPENAEAWYAVGANRFWKANRLRLVLSKEDRLELGEESLKALFKASDIDPSYPEPYIYVNLVYRNIHANIYPDRAERYIKEAGIFQDRFKEARKKQAEKRKLERELRGER